MPYDRYRNDAMFGYDNRESGENEVFDPAALYAEIAREEESRTKGEVESSLASETAIGVLEPDEVVDTVAEEPPAEEADDVVAREDVAAVTEENVAVVVEDDYADDLIEPLHEPHVRHEAVEGEIIRMDEVPELHEIEGLEDFGDRHAELMVDLDDLELGIGVIGEFEDKDLIETAIRSAAADIAASIVSFAERDTGFELTAEPDEIARTISEDLVGTLRRQLDPASLYRFGHVNTERVRPPSPAELAEMTRRVLEADARRNQTQRDDLTRRRGI